MSIHIVVKVRAFFNYITTGAFPPVGPLLAPVVKHDFRMSWALLIISKRLTLLKNLHLHAFSYPLPYSGGAKRGLCVWNTPNGQVVGKLFNPSWMKRNTN